MVVPGCAFRVHWLHFSAYFPNANGYQQHSQSTLTATETPCKILGMWLAPCACIGGPFWANFRRTIARHKQTQRTLKAHASCAMKCKHCTAAAQILRNNHRNGLQPCCLGALWSFKGMPCACIGCTFRPTFPAPMDTNSTAKAHSQCTSGNAIETKAHHRRANETSKGHAKNKQSECPLLAVYGVGGRSRRLN